MATFSWYNGISGDWNTAADWTPAGGPPNASTATAVVAAAGTYVVTIDMSETANAVTLNAAGADLNITATGSLTLAGTSPTLMLNAGTFDLAGELIGGTVTAGGANIILENYATLDAVTWQGPLALTANNGLCVMGGLTVLTATGGVPGSIDLSAGGAALLVLDSEMMNNATLAFGGLGGGDLANYDTLGGPLTLGSAFNVTMSGGYNQFVNQYDGTIVNAGTVNIAGGYLQVLLGGFANSGIVQVNGGTLDLSLATLTNSGSISVGTRGDAIVGAIASDTAAIAVTGGGTVELQTNGLANVSLSGSGDTVILDQPAGFTGTIYGFTAGDTIDLSPNPYSATGTAKLQSGNTLQVIENGTTLGILLNPAQSYAGATFNLSSDTVTGGTDITITSASPAITLAPVAGGNTVNAAAALSGFAITGATTNITNGQTATIAIRNAASVAVDTYAAVVNGGTWSVAVTPAQAQALADGVYSVTASVSNAGGTAAPQASEQVTVNLAGIVAATSVINTSTVAFGATRVGGTAVTQTITVGDGTVATTDQSALSYALGTLPTLVKGDATASGTITSGASQAVDLILNTATAGSLSATVPISLTSVAPSGSGLTNAALTAGTIAVSGAVYAPAVATVGSTLNFGVVHVGDTVSTGLTITNAATGALTDVLTGGFGTVSGAFTGTGSLGAGLASGASGSLTLSMNTAASGVVTGSAALTLASHDAALSDIAVAANAVTLTGTVDNYAVAALEEVSGGGTLTQNGTAYTLDLGSMTQGSTGPTVNLGALNAASGLADLLSGTFQVSGGSGFINSGLTAFSGLAAGQADVAPTVSLSTGTIGTFTETITLTSTGSNSGGYSGALAAETLTIIGTVTPMGQSAPGVYTLTTGTDTINGTGNDTIVAASLTLSQGDTINAGTGTNTLALTGGGTFNLGLPTTLTGVQTITAAEGQGATAQTITLRAGLNATVNVASDTSGDIAPTITIIGAANSDIINLGSGNDIVTLGAGETVNGGGGNDVFNVTAATIGDTIKGGTGVNTLAVSNGGTVTMGGAITGISTVTLGSKTTFTANGTANLRIAGSAAGGDVITLGSASQSVIAGGTNETIRATAANAGASITGIGSGGTLAITTGGTVTMNSADTVSTVTLNAATMLKLNGMSFLTAIGSSGADTIAAGGVSQTLTGGSGGDTLVGYTGGGDTFRDTISGLNGDIIQNFVATDTIDVTNLRFSRAKLSVAASGSNTIVTATSGTSKVVFTMAGNYSSSGFHLASDGVNGTFITHS